MLLNKLLLPIVLSVAALCAGLQWVMGGEAPIIKLLGSLGWLLVALLWIAHTRTISRARKVAQKLGLPAQKLFSLEEILELSLGELQKTKSLISVGLVEGRISSSEALTQSLERIANQAKSLLPATSVELTLFDEASGLYHSSILVGESRELGIRYQNISASTTQSLIEPIAFAGSILGHLIVNIPLTFEIRAIDRERLKVLSLMSGLIIVNAEYTKELVRMRRHSDESVKAKTGFLANLSHEIRGPLGIILNAVELMQDGLCGELTPDMREMVSMIRGNGSHLLELINDVLDYAKIESGKLQTEKADIVANDLLQDLAQVVRAQADAKQHKLIVTESNEELAFSCDRRHARQMLINMLTNAIKYTPDKGTIVIWAERVPGNKMRIAVKDTGVGIAPEDKSKVFAAFERIENSYSIKQIGTGLGMPLTKRLAEVNGGTVEFESEPGKGSTFYLVMPSIPYSPFMRQEEKPTEADAVGKGETVLLIEEDAAERRMVGRYLGWIGFKVIEATTPSQVLDILRKEIVNLIVLDNKLMEQPEGDILSLIRAHAHENARILLLSSRAFTFDVERYLKAGVDRCVAKPVPLKSLGHISRELLDGIVPSAKILKSGKSVGEQTKSGKKIDNLIH